MMDDELDPLSSSHSTIASLAVANHPELPQNCL
jgi:hypothetical protein